jgi:hypothetical protein
LDVKKLGPFKITQIINPVAFHLKIPCTMQNHDVFNVFLLTPRSSSPFHPVTHPPLPVVIDEKQEWEFVDILDSKLADVELSTSWNGLVMVLKNVSGFP